MQRKIYLFIRVVIIVIVLFGITGYTDVTTYTLAEATTKAPTLKETSITLYKGKDNYKIKLLYITSSAKVTYKSSNNNVAMVSSKGVVTPISIGEAKINISIKQNNKTYKPEFIVKVKEPEKVKLTTKQIYSKCTPCTVDIEAKTYKGNVTGSGFFIDSNTIVTTFNVIKDSSKITVTTSDSKKYLVKRIKGYDQTLDIALLEIEENHDSLPICETITAGEETYAFGSPLGLSGTMTKGIISTESRIIDGVEYIQTDAAISKGSNGGPLVNVYGEVIGINRGTTEIGQKLNFAISIKELSKIDTSKPQTIEEYFNVIKDNWRKEHVIKEDPERSKTNFNCQKVKIGTCIEGTLKADEYIDWYCVDLTENEQLWTSISTNNTSRLEDFMKLLIYITDDNGREIFAGHNLKPGKYYISVRKDFNTNMSDFNYVLYINGSINDLLSMGIMY